MTVRALPSPSVNSENRAYFEAAAEGRLLIKHCTMCNSFHHYPRELCPFCLSRTEWTESTGQGRIYSWTLTRRGVPVPYVLAYVTLAEEGVTLLTNIVDSNFEDIHIGDSVEVVFKECEDGTIVPCFKVVGHGGDRNREQLKN